MRPHPIDVEALVRAQAMDLIQCGLRPAVIRMLCGTTLSVNDYQYLYKAYSPLPIERRQGRLRFNPEVTGLRRAREQQLAKFSRAAMTMLIDGIEMANEALGMGASKADAVAASWRILSTLHAQREVELIHDVGAEDLATLWLNFQAGEILISRCNHCHTRFIELAPGSTACNCCNAKAVRRTAMAA